jgi:hypothetical protein
MILFNGRVHSQQNPDFLATAVKIFGCKIVAVGSDDEILPLAEPQEELMDLNKRTVLPGLTDSHIHLELYSFFLQQVDCETDTLSECLVRVSEHTHEQNPECWIRGHGWNHNVWAEGFGRAIDLDRLTGDTPVYLTAKSGHAGWANSAALRRSGVTSSTADPSGGKIQRDSRGEPTGIFLENAMGLIERCIPAPSIETTAKAILSAQKILWQFGLTGVHDFDGAGCFSALQLMDQNHQLHLRVNKSIPASCLSPAIALGLHTGFGSETLRVGCVKLFADGALGPQTAAMIQPYQGSSDQYGMLLLDTNEAVEIGQKAVKNGLSLAIHAIGDQANHQMLNAYSQIRDFEKANDIAPLRHRIEHVQCLAPQDQGRLAGMDIIASMQPLHATSDMIIADKYWGARTSNAYTLQTLHGMGTHMAYGSDAPVESPNPFLGLHAAVTRCRVDESPSSEGWYPNQRLNFHQALSGYTTGAAYAANREQELGQIGPGFFADLILMDIDPFSIHPQDLHSLRPCATMFAGQWVWQA